MDDIYHAVLAIDEPELVTASNVPQFSKLEAAFQIPGLLNALQDVQTFEALGIYLDYEMDKKATANKKYGENHAKLATLLDLVEISSSHTMQVSETCFGNLFCMLSDDEKMRVAARLAFRIPVVQRVLIDAASGEVCIADYLKPFSESTKKRRLPNVRSLLNLIDSCTGETDVKLIASLRNVRELQWD